jgi:hypothetical protein
LLVYRFYSTDSTFIHGGVDRPGCVEQPAVGPDNISQRIHDLNLRDCHAKIRQVDSHPTIGDGVVVQVNSLYLSCFLNENIERKINTVIFLYFFRLPVNYQIMASFHANIRIGSTTTKKILRSK